MHAMTFMKTRNLSGRCLATAGALALLLALSPPPARAAEVLVAVAANFAEVIDTLEPVFEDTSGHVLRVSVGSTGKLYAQIKAGAPFHVLLAADQERPARLLAEGNAVAGSRFTYAVGRLTLWRADAGRIGNDPVATLLDDDVRYIAIANPDLAPYGAAAREVLGSLGVSDRIAAKTVMGQNIGQTFSMVATGNAQLGLVALSTVLSPRNPQPGSRWDVPADLHAPIRQDAVLLNAGADNPAALAFLAFLQSAPTRDVMARFGYGME